MDDKRNKLKVLFFLEGNADIRFISGLSQHFDLTLAGPIDSLEKRGLEARILDLNLNVKIVKLPSGRLTYQWKSFLWLWKNITDFDIVLAQEVLRGAFNASLVGKLRGVPVATHTGIAPVEYFLCKEERGQISPVKALIGVAIIRFLMWANGKLASRWIVVGPYLPKINQKWTKKITMGLIYGVNTSYLKPLENQSKQDLRQELDLPLDKFIIFNSSRISHEKDPETVLLAVQKLRLNGMPAMVLNLSGSHDKFLDLAISLGIHDAANWVLARPAVHPMKEIAKYYQASDCVAQASLAEGCGLSPLEGMSCGIPTVASAVGGMGVQLPGYARMAQRRDVDGFYNELKWIYENPNEAKEQALKGREFAVKNWDTKKALSDLDTDLRNIIEQDRV